VHNEWQAAKPCVFPAFSHRSAGAHDGAARIRDRRSRGGGMGLARGIA
jgi:hypothetical protein